ncbi:MAG: hypothetical protein AAF772_03110 [Acidobacteriota bacterium]
MSAISANDTAAMSAPISEPCPAASYRSWHLFVAAMAITDFENSGWTDRFTLSVFVDLANGSTEGEVDA